MELTKKQERISDLLCSAFEGGSNDWYWISKFNYPKGENKKSLGIEFAHIELPFVKGGSLTITDKLVHDEYQFKPINLDLKTINKGLKVMHEKYPKHYANWLSENDDDITADVFLQCCCFGEIIFC